MSAVANLGPSDDVEEAAPAAPAPAPESAVNPLPALRLAVVVPAFNEAAAITAVVRSVPSWVERVIVVDDASADDTAARVRTLVRPGLELVVHRENHGVGAAIVTGYRRALARGIDVVVVMAGDGQMDPADLPALLAPIAAGGADYVKGNRFKDPAVWSVMPPARIFGNLLLSLATKVTSGYRQLFDSQCGYTAATRGALQAIDLDRVFPRYGYPNDVLARLHAAGMRVSDAPVRAVYGPGWHSGIKVPAVVYPISWVLLRSWLWRVAQPVLRALPARAGREAASE